MAENKKSFVLYADLIKSIDHLTNEEKGILFNHLLEYVNDQNPILEDRLILTAWKPIELQLKRDLKRYEGIKTDRSISGRIGNLKRYNLDIYRDVESEKITLEEGEKIAKARKGLSSDKGVAKLAVNVNDNDNDNDIKDIELGDNSPNLTPPKIEKTSLREKREKDFYQTLAQHLDKFPKSMIRSFYDYWSEPTKSGHKMKFELEKTWDLERRLAKWQLNDDKWAGNQNPKQNDSDSQQKPISQAVKNQLKAIFGAESN